MPSTATEGSPPGPQRTPGSSKLRALLALVVTVAAASLLTFLSGATVTRSSGAPNAHFVGDPLLVSHDARRMLATLKAMDSMAESDISGVASQQRALERQLLALTSRLDGVGQGGKDKSGSNSFAAASADATLFAQAQGDREGGQGTSLDTSSNELSGSSDSRYAMCQVALNKCNRDLDKAKMELEDAKAPSQKQDGATQKDDDVIKKLERENKALQQEVEALKAKVGGQQEKAEGAPEAEAQTKLILELKGQVEELRKERAAQQSTNQEQAKEESGAVEEMKKKLEKLRKENEDLKKQSGQANPMEHCAEKSNQQATQNQQAGQSQQTAEASGQSVATPNGEEISRLKRQLREMQEKQAQAMLGSESDGKKAMEAAKKVLEDCKAVQAASSSPARVSGTHISQCQATDEELKQYLNYKPREQCPDDWYFVQKLIFLKSCFALPTRLCFAPMPEHYKEPTIPFPQSLFDQRVLRNENVRWTKQYWGSYDAINNRTLGDCRDCFNLTKESWRWQVEYYGTVPIDYVLSLKPKGAIKIGLDAGGGTGSFAAKMAEHGVTIVTTAMNTETLGDREGGLPYMDTIAQRGLVPLHIPHRARQPFFDGTLDIIHNINSVKYLTIPEFEELMFEWDRILRPGGIMWFELFYAPIAEMPLYISVLDVLGYRKLYWNMTPKEDAAERKHMGAHVYLNAVLEKPRRKDMAPKLEKTKTEAKSSSVK